MSEAFEKWWEEANEGADTAEKDAKFPQVKELAKAAFLAGAASRDEEIEQLRVQLAGCGVAAMCNTRESMEQQRCLKGGYGYSASYQDVLNAVSREIALREEVELLKQEIQSFEVLENGLVACNHDLQSKLSSARTSALEEAAKVAEEVKYPVEFIYAEEMDGFNAARMMIAEAIRGLK